MFRHRLFSILVSALALGVTQAGQEAGAADLTELSLEALMQVQLPPLKASTVFVVSATAVDSCAVTASDHAFGNYDPLAPTPTDATSTITVTCTVNAAYEIGLSAGTGAGGNSAARRMQRDNQTLVYSLYRDSARTLAWGDRYGADTAKGIGTGMPINHLVFGRIPARQAVRSGRFVDHVVATVYY